MEYTLTQNKIVIFDREDFEPQHILECGQIFCYKKNQNGYDVLSGDKMAKIIVVDKQVIIQTNHTDYFENFFDLKTDYGVVKRELLNLFPHLTKMITYGHGIRILNQDKLETMIGFIISANNNIERIKKSMFFLREHLGEFVDDYFAFPTLQKLLTADENFFVSAGLGYRAKQMVKAINQIKDLDFEQLEKMETLELRKTLIGISGIGGKVADCILLFAFHRQDVFPVDTWVEKIYFDFFDSKKITREKMRDDLLDMFGSLSGYAQQYLFYFKRSSEKI